MTFIRFSSFTFLALLLSSCGGSLPSEKQLNDVDQLVPEITDFSFLVSDNPELSEDIKFTLDEANNKFNGNLPDNLSVKDLIAHFSFNGTRVEVDGLSQRSGFTSNDFTHEIIYKVFNSSNDYASYTVDLVKFTGLPIVSIYTEDSKSIDTKSSYVKATMHIDGWRHFDDLPGTEIEIRGRGHSTWEWYPKKPYQIKLSEANSVLGLPEAKRWVLLAEYADKTMIRNKIAFEFGKLSKLYWTPSSEFAELFLNDEYIGTYHLTEKIEINPNRLPPNYISYLLEIDQLERLDEDATYFTSNFFVFSIKDPDLDESSHEIEEIRSLLLEFEDALINHRFFDHPGGYESFIDVNSFIDWFLINELTKNIDAGEFYSSVYLTINEAEKIELGPIWDFDLSMAGDYEGWWMVNTPWFELLMLDPIFIELVKDRFNFFNENRDSVINKINEHSRYLEFSSQLNDSRWGTLGNYVFPNPVYFETYEEEIAFLETWIDYRFDWLVSAFSNF